MAAEYTGKCHCGRVRYRIAGPVRQVVECHCESCRRITGSVWHATGARQRDVTITDDDGALHWYRSSEKVERGFCGNCGASLFFRRDNVDIITITAGSLDQPTGLHLMMRIFTDDMADYAADTSGDDIPRFPEYPPMHHFAIPEE
ncbi:MAG: GFA family protein [Alphaproteobacteria bacterium]|nr:GFA family protein [Alphaproteobacteria bacterium]